MALPTPELTQREVDPPDDRWCEGAMGGHKVPEGAKFQGKPTRFFTLSGKGLPTPVTVCEPCLVVANYMAAQKRKLKKLKEELRIEDD